MGVDRLSTRISSYTSSVRFMRRQNSRRAFYFAARLGAPQAALEYLIKGPIASSEQVLAEVKSKLSDEHVKVPSICMYHAQGWGGGGGGGAERERGESSTSRA